MSIYPILDFFILSSALGFYFLLCGILVRFIPLSKNDDNLYILIHSLFIILLASTILLRPIEAFGGVTHINLSYFVENINSIIVLTNFLAAIIYLGFTNSHLELAWQKHLRNILIGIFFSVIFTNLFSQLIGHLPYLLVFISFFAISIRVLSIQAFIGHKKLAQYSFWVPPLILLLGVDLGVIVGLLDVWVPLSLLIHILLFLYFGLWKNLIGGTIKKSNQIIALNTELKEAYDTTLEGWARALELKDKETEGHSRRVVDLTLLLARAVNYSEEDIIHLKYGALLHDIGKMAIPDDILNKPTALSIKEMEIMKKHTDVAYQLLKSIKFLEKALVIPRYHHEKWDGSGYPYGIQGENIPIEARIFTIVDVWDALTSKRPYREAWDIDRVREYFKAQKELTFDPDLTEIFLELVQ